jgi:hypothetical protein
MGDLLEISNGNTALPPKNTSWRTPTESGQAGARWISESETETEFGLMKNASAKR